VTAAPGTPTPCPTAQELSRIHEELGPFARVEHLVGEETRLLAERLEHRKQERRDRPRALGAELDRIWETPRERAERLDNEGPSPGNAS
jgi:hypothetical protein